jgi:hypothetical protein
MNSAGNTSGSTFDVGVSGEIRNNRFTSRSFVGLTRKNITYGFGQGTVDFTERTLREQADFALSSRTKVVAGIEDYQNTLMFMDKRQNIYGGVGAVLYRDPKHQATFTGGLGHASFIFNREKMAQRLGMAGVDALSTSPGSGGAIGVRTWRWKVSSRLIFNEDATYMRYFDSYLGFRWGINLSATAPITKKVSFNVMYRIKRENNTIIRALGLEPQDRMFVLGIRISS